MATRGENCNDWPRTVMTGGCSLVAFAPDGATGKMMMMKIQTKTINISTRLWGITLEFVGFIPQSLVLRSIVLG